MTPQGEFKMTIGRVNPKFQLQDQGIKGAKTVHYNLNEPLLIQRAIERGEGNLGQGGTLLVETGKHTGTSSKCALGGRTGVARIIHSPYAASPRPHRT